MTPELRRERIEQFARHCRERGLPLTTQRRAVLEAILDRRDHPTADQVCDVVRRTLSAISRTTVYRILDTLVEAGMVTKVCHPGSAARYDPKIRQHHHLVCLCCERIIDIEQPHLNQVSLPDVREHGFQISDYHIHFRGLCAECARKQKSKARTTRPIGRSKAVSKATSLKRRGAKERKRP